MAARNTKYGLVQKYRFGVKRVVLIALACVFAVLGVFMLAFNLGLNSRTTQVATQYIATQPVTDVLLIMSYDESENNTPLARDGVVDVMQRSSVGVDVVYMDAHNAPRGSAAYTAWVEQLHQKVANHGAYGAVICADDEALYFIEDYHETMFASTPVVFFGVNDHDHAAHAVKSGYMTGMVEQCYCASMIKVASDLMPQATSYMAIYDNTPAGIGDHDQFVKAVSKVSTLPVTFVNASTLTREELAENVSSVGTNTIVFLLDANNDRNGNVYGLDETVAYLTKASCTPIYRTTIGGVGGGVAGSGFIDPENDGRRAAEITIRVLNGASPSSIELVTDGTKGYVFDQQVLNQYGISTANLPAGSTVVNRDYFSLDTLQVVLWPVIMIVIALIFFAWYRRVGKRRKAVLAQMGAPADAAPAGANVAQAVATAPAPVQAATASEPSEKVVDQAIFIDNTTGCQNMQWLAEYGRSSQAADIKAVAMVDFFNFDEVIELFGTNAGDEVLRAIAKRLDGVDKVFLVRCETSGFILGFDNELSLSSQELELLEYLLRQPLNVEDNSIELDARIGVANRFKGMSIDDLVSGARYAEDQATFMGGSHSIVFFDINMKRAMENEEQILPALKRAIKSGDFIVFYQPQIDAVTNDVAGYEALVRLKNNAYPPDQFLLVAYMNDLICDIERIVATRAVEQLAKWKKRNKRIRPISIKMSSAHLTSNDDFHAFLVDLLAANDIPACNLRLEITGGFFNSDADKADELLGRFIADGIFIVFDRFGMGYTTLTDVMTVPAEMVKIDRTLVDVMAGDGSESSFENLVRIAHGLDKKVIVAGIEKKWQADICRDLDCDVLQGQYFAKPLLPENAVQYKPTE